MLHIRGLDCIFVETNITDMRSAHYLVIKKDQSSFVSKITLEHNMYFAKEEGIGWLTEKHDAVSVTYMSQNTFNQLYKGEHPLQHGAF